MKHSKTKRTWTLLIAGLMLVAAVLTLLSCASTPYTGAYVSGDMSLTFDGNRVTIRDTYYTGTATYSVTKENQKTYFNLDFAEGEYDFDLAKRYVLEEGDGFLILGGRRFVRQ